MKAGYKSELESRKGSLQDSKTALEVLYAKINEDAINKNPELKEQHMTALRVADSAIDAFSGSLKTVKVAIESRLLVILR